jgi:hypothetical protein
MQLSQQPTEAGRGATLAAQMCRFQTTADRQCHEENPVMVAEKIKTALQDGKN